MSYTPETAGAGSHLVIKGHNFFVGLYNSEALGLHGAILCETGDNEWTKVHEIGPFNKQNFDGFGGAVPYVTDYLNTINKMICDFVDPPEVITPEWIEELKDLFNNRFVVVNDVLEIH